MKRLIYNAIFMALVLSLPKFVVGQANLTGTWRLMESKKFKGPDYTNAVPLIVTIEQRPDVILLEITNNNGEKDTVVKESIIYKENWLNESKTTTGKKKTISFQKNEAENYWLKQTKIYTKDDSSKLQSVNKETFRLNGNGAILSIIREYDGNDDPKGNEDFTIEGRYEKVTPEKLAKETATGKGVDFLEGLNWEQIKAKAKQENKYIFVDCYATWCRPCKMMDKYVYPLNIVGEAMNDQFVAMKVQMDSTKNDQPPIKLLYSLARQLEKEYGINALPSYLFFSPNGTIVHKAIGQQDAKKFIELLANSIKPEKQLYTLLNKAKNRELPYTEYPRVAKRLKEEFYEKGLAQEVAEIYSREYLNKLSENDLLTKQNLDFIGEYNGMLKSTDRIFQLFLTEPNLVDSIKQYEGGGWANTQVTRIIIREEVDPFLRDAEKSGKEPQWVMMEKKLEKKYNKDLAITYVLDARVDWYEKKKNWTSFLQYVRPHLAKHDLKKISERHLHFCAWFVFKYSDDTKLLKEALQWVNILMEKVPKDLLWPFMDTKACLLYKIGERKEGIVVMRKLLEMYPQFNASFQPRLESMTKGEKIWLKF